MGGWHRVGYVLVSRHAKLALIAFFKRYKQNICIRNICCENRVGDEALRKPLERFLPSRMLVKCAVRHSNLLLKNTLKNSVSTDFKINVIYLLLPLAYQSISMKTTSIMVFVVMGLIILYHYCIILEGLRYLSTLTKIISCHFKKIDHSLGVPK
ncbi:hypothetical protein QTP88_007362 [Uroleucon formosanum]